MAFLDTWMSIGSLIYGSGTALVRYWYVSSSLQTRIVENFKSKEFIKTCIFFPQVMIDQFVKFYKLSCFQVFICIHFFNTVIFLQQNGLSKYPFILYRACVDPWSEPNDMPLYEVLPFDQALFYVYSLNLIFSNIYLFKYLRNKTETSTATKEADKKKERKRNFVPAQTGFISLVVLILGALIYSFIYNYSAFTHRKMDSGTRSFILNAWNDFYDWILSPCALLYGTASMRRKLMRLKNYRFRIFSKRSPVSPSTTAGSLEMENR